MKKDSDPHGWRIAGLVVALALALTAGAHYIHTKVDCNPAHPYCIKSKAAPEHAAAGDHAAPADHGGAADHKAAPGAADHAHPADTSKKAADTAKKGSDHGKGGY